MKREIESIDHCGRVNINLSAYFRLNRIEYNNFFSLRIDFTCNCFEYNHCILKISNFVSIRETAFA